MSENIIHDTSPEPIEDAGSKRFSKLGNVLLIGAAVSALLFEQTPANEAFRVNAGLDVLETTESALAVGGITAALTSVIEMGSATLASLGLNSKGEYTSRFMNWVDRKFSKETKDDEEPKARSKIFDSLANAGIALGIGAALVTLKKHRQDPDPSLKKDLVSSAKATGIVAGVSGTIGYLVAGGINHAVGTPFETPAEYVVDYGTDTRFWLSALAIGYSVAYAKKGIDKIRNKDSDDQDFENGIPTFPNGEQGAVA